MAHGGIPAEDIDTRRRPCAAGWAAASVRAPVGSVVCLARRDIVGRAGAVGADFSRSRNVCAAASTRIKQPGRGRSAQHARNLKVLLIRTGSPAGEALMAGLALSTLPLVIPFVLSSRRPLAGLTAGAVN